MLQEHAEAYSIDGARQARRASRSLQIVLWTLWSLVIAGTAFYRWYADMAADRPLNVVGLVIYSGLAGLIGLLIITIAEMRLDPEWFLDEL
jgi:hypothetical protein